MELLIFAIILCFFFILKSSSNKAPPKPPPKPIRCHDFNEGHDWSYHPVTKRLTCTVCDYEAGSNEP